MKERGIKPVILPKSNRSYSKTIYRQRNCIERVLDHFKINHAVATRYDQRPENFLGTIFITSAQYWIKLTWPSCIARRTAALPPALSTGQRSTF